MNINKDYSRALRCGKWLDKESIKKENEAGVIVFFSLTCALFLLLIILI